MINTIYNNLFGLTIGKVFSSEKLGFYTQAEKFSWMLSNNTSGIVQRVVYPVLCSLQDDKERLRDTFRKLLKASTFVISPLMCLLASVSRPLIIVLLGEQWQYSSVLLVPLCISGMWYPVHYFNLSLLQAMGRSDLFLKLEIVKKTIGVSILILSIPYGLLAMCYSLVVIDILNFIVNTYYTGKLFGVGALKQIKDIMPTFISSLIVLLCVKNVISYLGNLYIQIISGLILGLFIYIFVAFLLKMEEIDILSKLIREKVYGRK